MKRDVFVIIPFQSKQWLIFTIAIFWQLFQNIFAQEYEWVYFRPRNYYHKNHKFNQLHAEDEDKHSHPLNWPQKHP